MIDRKHGTIRSKRNSKNLLDSPFRIDDRSFSDILGYMSSYLNFVNFYNLENNPTDEWKNILKNDPIIYLVIIINEPTTELNQKIRNITTNNPEGKKLKIELINALLKWHSNIQEWQLHLNALGEQQLAQKINNVLVDVLDFQKSHLLKHKLAHSTKAEKRDKTIQNLMAPEPSIPTPNQETEVDLGEIAHNYYRIIIHIKQITKHYLEQHLLTRSNHKPNNALYIAFTLLLKNIQKKTNQLSKDHLDFYYKDILKQQSSKGKPTKSIVSFDLQPNVKYTQLAEGTMLSAGKPFEGKEEVNFKTDKPLILYPIELSELKTILFNRNPFINIGTSEPTVSSIQFKNLMSKGSDVTERKEWYTFGANKESIQNTQINSKYTAEIGFLIGSPVLKLSEGTRIINLVFNLDNSTAKAAFWKLLNQIKTNTKSNLNTVVNKIFKDGLDISYTSKKGWTAFSGYEVFFDEIKNFFTIQLVLKGGEPPLANALKIKEQLKWPSIRILLNKYSPSFLYSFFLGVEVDSIDIDVEVRDLKNLSLYNNLGKIASNISFAPFGPAPSKGAYLMLGNEELFQKQINALEINMLWEGLPAVYGGFNTYYNGYSKEINNQSFTIAKSALSNSYWLPTAQDVDSQSQLFETEKCTTPEGYDSTKLSNSTTIQFNKFKDLGITPDFDLKSPLVYDAQSRSGFIKLTLTSPEFGFGNALYFKDYTEVATFNAKNKIQFPLPNQPYSPKTSEISVNYKASDSLQFKGQVSLKENTGEYYHITPFGQEEVLVNQTILKRTLVCKYEAEGYLIMGMTGVKETTTVSIYFLFLRSSTTVQLTPNLLTWEYFHNNHWDEFEEGEIIADGTNGFTKSGIVELTLPRPKKYDQKEIETFWVRISAKKGVQNFPIIKGIYFNAVSATCINKNIDVIGRVVPENNISKTVAKLPDIKKVHQPTESGFGVLAERGNQMYQRVSERLRHKQRAVSIWDYERLILENFDIVKVVKCTSLNENFKPVPGKVKVVVMSERWTKEERHYFSQNALNHMKLFLEKQANSLIEIQVVNPSIEYLLVNCIVEFKPENNGGYYLNLLSNDLSDFLSPISKIETGVGGIGGKVDPTMVGSFIENRPYIKELKDLSVEHIIRKGVNDYSLGIYRSGEEILTTTPWSTFSPAMEHNIIPLINKVSPQALNNGIGSLEIGLDMIVKDASSNTLEQLVDERLLQLSKPDEENEPVDDSIFVFKHKS